MAIEYIKIGVVVECLNTANQKAFNKIFKINSDKTVWTYELDLSEDEYTFSDAIELLLKKTNIKIDKLTKMNVKIAQRLYIKYFSNDWMATELTINTIKTLNKFNASLQICHIFI
jgi:hypothetical protein